MAASDAQRAPSRQWAAATSRGSFLSTDRQEGSDGPCTCEHDGPWRGLRRAYHDAYDTPKVIEDRFAALFVSPEEATAVEDGCIHMLTRARPHLVVEGDRAATLANAMRTDTGTPLILGRTCDNEDLLEAAIRNGVTLCVMVGVGFDTFALRRPDLRDRIRVFEIDHPTTQDLKRQRLRDAGLDTPMNVHRFAVLCGSSCRVPTM